jgi:hypothetical protein
MQVKTQKQVMVLQNKAQKVADKLNEEVIVIAKGVQHIQVQAGTAYQLNAKDFDAKKSSLIAKKVGDDLEVALEEGVIIFDNYFAVCATDLSCLVSLPTEDGGLYHIVADASFTLEDGTQIVYFYGDRSIVSTESSVVSTDDTQSFSDVIASNVGIVAAVVVAAVVVAGSSGNGDDGNGDDADDDGDNKLSFSFKDTGLLDNDGITNNNTITIDGLKEGETWKYSIDGGATFKSSTGGSFTLDDNIYVADAIQIKKLDAAGNTLSITKVNELSPITIDTMKSVFTSSTTINIEKDTAALTTIYTAVTTDNDAVTYTLKDGHQKEKFTIDDTGELKYKEKRTQVGDHKVTIVATDIAGNKTEQLITVSVEGASLSTSVVWNGIGDDDKINANEMVAATLSGTVAIIGAVNSISISSIVFKQGDTTVHAISANLLSINSNNTWTLDNNDTWTSKLTQGDYTVTVYLSGNGGSVTDSNSITTTIDTVKPAQPAFSFEDTGSLNNDGITNNGVITINNLEVGVTWQYSVNGGNDFIDGTGSSFTLANNTTYVANAIQIKQTDAVGNVSDIGKNTLRIVVDNANPIFNLQPTAINVDVDTPITTTVYDAQATNLNGGNADEGITYSIKGTNADKFSITTDTGILTYKTIQTSAHDNDTVTIVATDVAGNETEQLITVSVKIFTRGFVINGKNVNDESGHSVSTAGDVNGDGLDDLIIGALNADPSNKKLSAGKSYVVFGKIDNTTIELSTIANGTGGFIINGEIQYDRSGASVSNAGDVNGDGLDDLIVGARNAGLNDKKEIGKSYIIFGKIDSTAINLSAIASGTGGFVINGENAMDYSGWSVSTAGDVNGDNLDDLIVSAYGADPSGKESAGKSYVIFGKTDNTVINLSDIGTGGFVINGENAGDKSGWSASNAGDVNGDGLDDLIIGASKADPNGRTDAGKSYIVFGKTDNTAINLSAIANGTGGFVINSERVWINWNTILVSNAGDVNGDGLDDLIIGAKSASPNNKAHAGKSYVIFGKTDNTAIDLSAIGTAGFVINGEKSGDWSGVSISTAGDVNGDGLDDLIVGADQVDLNGKLNIGKSYVVFGKTDNTEINLSAIVSGTGGFVINGENAYDYSGYSVSTAGDVNGDGLDDLIVGAYNADPNNQRGAGKSYVIFGKTDTDTINLVTLGRNSKYAIDYLGDENANTFTGTNNDEIFVAGTGDDTLIGNGGMDVLNAGAGNDTIVINASNVAALAQTGAGNRARVDGGGNIDTLTLDGSGLTLDLTNISNIRIQDIEKIDITGSGNNTLILNLNDVFDASTSTNILKVLGNSGDSVNASGFAKISGAKTESSITYDVYTHSGANTDANAALWVQQDVGVVL